MSNGKAATTQAFLLAALLASIGGCDSEAQPYARYQVDVVRNRAWSLSAGGLSFHDRSAPGKTVQVPLPGWHWAGPPYGCLPDLAPVVKACGPAVRPSATFLSLPDL